MLFDALLATLLAGSAAIVLVLLLRAPLRRLFGPRVAYGGWLLLPVAMLCALLPARTVAVDAPLHAAPVVVAAAAVEPGGEPSAIPMREWKAVLTAAWMLGTCLVLAAGAFAQRRFERSLGRLCRRADGLYQADAEAGLPAVVGLAGRIVLPADFERRYDAMEQRLILEHERCHAARRDHWVNAGMLLLCALYWFNPLAWLAAHRLRRDQELACDAAVIARHPDERRRYAGAMLKIELSSMPAPAACHWSGAHPMKERIMMLKQPSRGGRVTRFGAAAVLCLAGLAGLAAWAAQPAEVREGAVEPAAAGTPAVAGEAASALPPGDFIDLAFRIRLAGVEELSPRLIVADGKPFSVRLGGADGAAFELEMTARRLDERTFSVGGRIGQAGETLAEPTLVVEQGRPGSLRIGESTAPAAIEIELVATAATHIPGLD